MNSALLLALTGSTDDVSAPAYLFFLLVAIALSLFGMLLPVLLPLAAAGILAGIVGLSVAAGRRDSHLGRVWAWVLAPSTALAAAYLVFLWRVLP